MTKKLLQRRDAGRTNPVVLWAIISATLGIVGTVGTVWVIWHFAAKYW